MTGHIEAQIRGVVAEHAALHIPVDTLADDADLFQAGMTSFSSVNVMLALEETFGIEFPDAMLTRETFTSITSIARAIETVAPPT